ncbi:MAG: GNAT family N-acetyltransferase [Anaerolineaceae bacterium]|nr:GNAT family N-acetyltransferase [Anaerolineaceae bacterium]
MNIRHIDDIDDFTFLDPGTLVDGDLTLVLVQQYPGDRAKIYVPAYIFRLEHTFRGCEMGRLALRVGNLPYMALYNGHIGYSALEEFRGNHFAARAVKRLLPLACRHGFGTLWITCSPENLASRRTCELAGATFIEIVDLPDDTELYQRGERQVCRYRLDL